MSDPNDPYSGGAVPPPPPPPPPGGAIVPPPPPGQDPYAQQPPAAYPPQDPYAQQPPAAYPPQDPYAQQPPVDPYAQPAPPADPYAQQPPAAYPPQDPYAQQPPPPGPPQDPYGQQPPAAYPPYDPYAQQGAAYGAAGYQPYGSNLSPAPDGSAALSWGWKKLQENFGAIAIAIGVWIAATLVLGGLGWLLFVAIGSDTTSFVIASIALAVFMLLLWAAMYIGQYGIIRAALGISEGRAPTTAEMFKMDNFAPFILTSLLVALIQAVGTALCYLPGLVAMFFLMFAPSYAADKGMGAVDSVKASFNAVQRNAGPVAIFFLLSMVAYFVGSLLCGIGTLVAVPVVVLGSIYMYRAINNEPVAP